MNFKRILEKVVPLTFDSWSIIAVVLKDASRKTPEASISHSAPFGLFWVSGSSAFHTSSSSYSTILPCFSGTVPVHHDLLLDRLCPGTAALWAFS